MSDSRREYVVYDVNLPETQGFLSEGATDFVLSAWEKADSAYVPSERKTDYGCSGIDREHQAGADGNKKKRKFELRAELTYDDGKEEDYNASFDWLNTGWQYLAVPVTVKEENEEGDRLTGRFPFVLGGEDRKLTRLKIVVDYGYNVNRLEYDCLTLRQGSWTYGEFDADGKRIYSEDSASGVKTEYAYDENNNEVKTVVTDKQYRKYVNTREYDKRNRLVRSVDYTGTAEEIIYDEKGREVKTVTYNISDPTSKYYSESLRDEKGRVTADADITGEYNSAEYGFDRTGAVNVVADALGAKTALGYRDGELVSISGTCGGEENKNTRSVTKGYTTKVSSGGTDYGYSYDGWGRRKEITVGGEKYSTAEYAAGDKTTTVRLGTGESFTEYTDGKTDKPVEITLFNGEKVGCKVSKRLYAPSGGTEAEEQSVKYYDEETGVIARAIDKNGKKAYNTDYVYGRRSANL